MATRDGELFKEKIEVSLDGRQIFCLFCGGAVIASLVFVLGVMVGRRVEARGNPQQAAAGSPASDPLAALDQLAATGEADTATDAQMPSALREGQSGPLGPVDVSLGQPPAPPEEVKPADAKPEPPKPEAKPEPPKPEAKPEPPRAEPTPEPPKVEAKPVAPRPPDPARSRFTLQLSSFQARAEADAFMNELRKAGYAPTVVEASVEGKGTWYRVRLGAYASHDQALAAKAEFESKQKIIAYVTRVK